MTKLLAVSIALAALVGASAKAADTSMLKTPVPSEPPFAVYNWTGFYIGVQGGGSWARVEQTDARPFSSDPYFATGATIGGTIGVNMQSGQIVLGLDRKRRNRTLRRVCCTPRLVTELCIMSTQTKYSSASTTKTPLARRGPTFSSQMIV